MAPSALGVEVVHPKSQNRDVGHPGQQRQRAEKPDLILFPDANTLTMEHRDDALAGK